MESLDAPRRDGAPLPRIVHWADGALLSFLEHLADLVERSASAPSLYGPPRAVSRIQVRGRTRNAQTINLAPLSDGETAAARLPAGARGFAGGHAAGPARAGGGNPLYAEEYVRLLSDRGRLDEVDVPGSVQAVVRLSVRSPGCRREAGSPRPALCTAGD